MKSVIVFLKNVWNAQRNAKVLGRSDETVEAFVNFYTAQLDELTKQNAALRSQISQRDASGKFVKKNAS